MRLALLVMVSFAAAALAGADSSGKNEAKSSAAGASTAFERIEASLKNKDITLKESVILKAKALFAPEMLKDTKFALTGEEAKADVDQTGFFKQVHKVFKDFTPEDKDLLKKLSPDLKAIIEQREKEQENK